MYLFHTTLIDYVEDILSDGELKSNKLTSNSNWAIYDTSQYVYLSTKLSMFRNKISFNENSCNLYINPEILYNRKFYLSTDNVAFPEKTILNKDSGVFEYPRYYKNINNVLKILNKHGKRFEQVAILNKMNIEKYLVGIEFFKKPSKNILKILKNKYPNIKIKVYIFEKINKNNLYSNHKLINEYYIEN